LPLALIMRGGRGQKKIFKDLPQGVLPGNKNSVQGVSATQVGYAVGPRELGHKLIRVLQGRVVSTKMQKTLSVEVTSYIRHPLYMRYMKSSKRIFTHDENEEANWGDVVEIRECRPFSKNKHHILHRILKHRPELHYSTPSPTPVTYQTVTQRLMQTAADITNAIKGTSTSTTTTATINPQTEQQPQSGSSPQSS